MTGTLYLCATPIGNLEDITFRVLRTLKEVDLIAAEDTRNSIKLLNHFEIKTPMTSYHEFNKIDKAYQLVAKLKEGKNIALITDAGTPGISDPGEDIVRICYEEGVPVTSLPGAAACITALTMSGRPTRRFAFEAFLPRDKKERARVIEELKKRDPDNHNLRGASSSYKDGHGALQCARRQRTHRVQGAYEKARGKGADYIFGAFGAFKDTGAKRRICACNLWQKRG